MYIRAKFLLTLLLCFVKVSISVAAENALEIKWILPPIYFQGNEFCNGRVWVQEKKDGYWTLFDTEGNVIRKDFPAVQVQQYLSADTWFKAIEKDTETGLDMYGFLDDFSGDIISAAQPYEIFPPFYQEGIAAKKAQNGLYGCVDFKENWIIPPVYEDCLDFTDGLMPVKKDGQWGFINRKGEVVIDFRFEKVSLFKNGLFVASKNSLYGLVDKNGNWLTEAIYERFYYPWSELVGAQKDGKIGFLDAKGNVVIDFQFPGLGGTGIYVMAGQAYFVFYDGRAIVPLSIEKQGRKIVYKFGVINKLGNIIPTEQDGFGSGYYNGFAVATRDKKWFLADKDGNEYSLPPSFQEDTTMIYPSDDGIFKVGFKKENKTGYFRIEH